MSCPDLHDRSDTAPKLFFGVIGRVEEDPRSARYIFYQQVIAKLCGMTVLNVVHPFRYARLIGHIVEPRQLHTLAYLYTIEVYAT